MEWTFPVYNFTEKQHVTFRVKNIFSEDYLEAFQKFIHYYVPDVVAPFANSSLKLKPPRERVCRFCKKDNTEVSFKKVAHLLPHFLGNKHLIHYIECDNCNERFSKMETSFANYLGLIRTIDAIQGKLGIPKFKNNGLSGYSEKDEAGKVNIYLEPLTSEIATYMKEDDSIIINYKSSYVPLHIMKILFKIGYSMLQEEELEEYKHLDKIINTSELDDKLNEYCNVLTFKFSYSSNKPFVITYKKRPEYQDDNIPTKIVMLYFGRFMYEFVLLNSSDTFMIKKGDMGKVLYCPPYWDKQNGTPIQTIIDFSNNQLTKQEQSYQFKFDRNKE